MKTKNLALLLLVLAFTVSAIATEIPKMNVVAVDESKAYVTAVTSPNVASEVSVITENGEVVYYKRTKASNQFKTVLDLSQLEDGTYTVKLKTGKVSTQRNVAINQGKIAVERMQARLAPFYAYDGKMLKLTYLNYDKNNISMLLYNGSTLVDEFKLGNEFNIQRAFDVSNLVQGDYVFVLEGSNEFYNYKINR